MATVREIYQYLDGLAPFSLQMEFDNAGFLVGRGERAVSKILVSLDITEEVAEEAAELGAELIVSHHPVIFRPAKSVTDGDPDGRVLLALAEHRIAAICAHTNLDAVAGGVNDALALYTTFEVYAGPMAKLTPAELWAGRQTRGEGSPLRLAYLDRLLRQTERAIAGLKRSKRPEDASRLAELEQVHQGLLDMKEEWLSWQR